MGKARILSGGADGLYQIRIERDLARVQRRIDALTVERGQLAAQITHALNLRTAAADALLLAEGAAVTAWGATATASPDTYQQAMQAAGTAEMAVLKARGVLEEVDAQMSMLRLRDAAAGADIARLSAIPDHVDTAAWCADLTDDLAPDALIGLLVPGDERYTEPPLIRPAYTDRAVYVPARDGILQPAAAATPAGYVLNTMMLPCRQRWKPRHRIGTIIALDSDTCSVTLDDLRSSQQQLPTVPLTGGPFEGSPVTLTGVPIVYMNCNGAAFAPGDRVVVAFASQDQAQPQVVGFHSQPKPCGGPGWVTNTKFAVLRSNPINSGSTFVLNSEVNDHLQFCVISQDDTSVIDCSVSGSGTCVITEIDTESATPLGLGGVVSYELTIIANSTINETGNAIQLMHTNDILSETYYSQKEGNGLPEDCHIATYNRKITQTYTLPTIICENGQYEYWQIDVDTEHSSFYGPWNSGPDPENYFLRAFSTEFTQTINVSLRHSLGAIYLAETIERNHSESGYFDVFGMRICSGSIYFGTTTTFTLTNEAVVPAQIISRVTSKSCGTTSPPAAEGTINAQDNGYYTRTRTGLMTEPLVIPVGHYGNEALPISSGEMLMQMTMIPFENISDPDGVVTLPHPPI